MDLHFYEGIELLWSVDLDLCYMFARRRDVEVLVIVALHCVRKLLKKKV